MESYGTKNVNLISRYLNLSDNSAHSPWKTFLQFSGSSVLNCSLGDTIGNRNFSNNESL